MVDRIRVPGYLDTQDLMVRRGGVLERSLTGRWASRLSVGATDFMTDQLAVRRPDAVVTDGTMAGVPDYEIRVHVGELDLTSAGEAVMAADWQIIPRDAQGPIAWEQIRFTMQGSVADDASVAHLQRQMFQRLAAAIDERLTAAMDVSSLR